MKIDLGTKEAVSVNYAGQSYEMTLPTVKQAQKLRNKLKDEGADDIDVFIELLSELGMPSDVAEDMTAQQLVRLSEGLLGSNEGK